MEHKKNEKYKNCCMFYVPCSMKKRGFTIIELMIVISIVGALLGIVISNLPQVKLQFALSRVTYTFAQNVRRAQDLALSSVPYKDSSGQEQAVSGYGVFVDLKDDKKYLMYADKQPGNQKYGGSDYIVETIDFSSDEPGVIIKELRKVNSQNKASINFNPPNPDTAIENLNLGENAIEVVFALASDLAITRTVSVSTSGLIEIK